MTTGIQKARPPGAVDAHRVYRRRPMSPVLLRGLAALVTAATLGCGHPSPPTAPHPETEVPAPLVERAVELGLDFEHWNGMVGEYHFQELLPPGAAFLDFDQDGDLDAFFVQGASVDPTREPLRGFPGTGAPKDRIFRNDLRDGVPHFVDATAELGLESVGYGMGVAVGDVDNDGWPDLYVTRFGANSLWLNQMGDSFRDATASAGVEETRWSTSAAFVDVDRDGWLDLYVVNYVDTRPGNQDRCVNDAGRVDYCGPASFEPVTDRLWRNLGPDGEGVLRFEDVSASAGLLTAPGPGLGVALLDLDDDGWLDLYVANDQAANQLWRNGGRWSGAGPWLEDEAMVRGTAFDDLGRAQASMGVLAADFDGDGDEDLFMTHLLREVNTLYANDGRGLFRDTSRASGLGNASIGYTGFGTVAFDLENDGWLDLLTVNGEVRTITEQRNAGEAFPLRQPDQLFANRGGTFEEVSDRVEILGVAAVGRGAAVGDIDNDGDADVLVTVCDGRARLLVNRTEGATWLGVRALDRRGRDALGARLEVTAGPLHLVRRIGAGSFLSAHDPRVLFGLGDHRGAVEVTVRWPDGAAERFPKLEVGRYHQLRQGRGRGGKGRSGDGQPTKGQAP
ncbi:MAG: CRTAC1 family protein [Acidobacteriota bacterium]